MTDADDEIGHSAWRVGRFDGGRREPKLLFGRMFEDAAIERRVFDSSGRIFCIASAGCTALELACSGAQVTAVDVNPRQIAYVERRLRSDACEIGSADRVMSVLRTAAQCCGLRRESLVEFLEMDNPPAHLRFWREHIDRKLFRRATRLLLSQRVLRFAYAAPFLRALPSTFADILWARLERGISMHPNRSNPYAWRLFLGDYEGATCTESSESRDGCAISEPLPSPETREHVAPLADRVELVCSDAAAYLAKCTAGVFHGLTLSNILDGADASYAKRLVASMRHAAIANATLVLRSFSEPRDAAEEVWAAADRSLLWGRDRSACGGS